MEKKLKRESKVKLLNQQLNNLNTKNNTKINLEIKHIHKSILGAYSNKNNKKICISPDLIESLTMGELKALMFHEYQHFFEKTPSGWFWNYFIVKYLFLMYMCSYAFQWPNIVYLLLSLVILPLCFYIIYKSRRESLKAQKIELNCDKFAINLVGKEIFISLLKKIQKIDETGDLNLDYYIANKLLGRYHPSFDERIQYANLF